MDFLKSQNFLGLDSAPVSVSKSVELSLFEFVVDLVLHLSLNIRHLGNQFVVDFLAMFNPRLNF